MNFKKLTVWFYAGLIVTIGCKPTASQKSGTQMGITVTGVVLKTESYCGGAAPNPQLLEAKKIPRPLPGKTIYFKVGKANDPDKAPIAQVTANEQGEFNVSLEPGFYVIVDEKRMDKASYNYMLSKFAEKTETYTAVDKKCLDEWITRSELAFEVKKEGNAPLNVVFHKPCSWKSFPCVTFLGENPGNRLVGLRSAVTSQ